MNTECATAEKRTAAAALCLVFALFALLVGVTGCKPTPDQHTGEAVVTEAEVVDFTGSALATDTVQMAENIALEKIKSLPTGEAMVISGFTADVTVACNTLTISIPAQNNPAQENELRRTIEAEFPAKFNEYADCLVETDTGGRSEIFGGLSDFFARYPDVTDVTVVSDGCENKTIRNICRPGELHEKSYPEQVVSSLPPALVPDLDGSMHIEYIGIGRGTGLDAAAVAGLRQVYATWTTKTNAYPSFGPT